MKLLFTPRAKQDFREILDYIAQSRPLTASRVASRIREQCGKLRKFPEIGQQRPEYAGNYRSFTIQRWVVFYRVANDVVEIHRILDGVRDIDQLLGG